MAGYCGSDLQARLQQAADENHAWTASTPGACDAGRMLGCDDVERLGWDRLLGLLRRDGAVAFRLIPAAAVAGLRERLALDGYRLDTWEVFAAPAAAGQAAVGPLLARGLPGDLEQASLGQDPEGPAVRSLQAFMLENGIVPFSGSQLIGARSPAATVALADAAGRWVAAAHCYLPHNADSPRRGWAWGGLVCVAPAQRGRGLGNLVNALALQAAVERLGATQVYELVSSGNLASRRMVESCGLRLDPTLACGIAAQGAGRYTR